jgi:DNA-binding transcriptional LysR family regulator
LSNQGFNIIAEMGSTESVIQGIKSRVGISILSPIAVTDELQAGTLKALKIKGHSLKRNFYLTRHKVRSASPLSKAFITFIKEFIQAADESGRTKNN